MTEKKEILIKLGARVRELRLAQGMTQVQLGHKIDRDKQSIFRLESGNINPTYINLLNISNGLGMTVSELLDF